MEPSREPYMQGEIQYVKEMVREGMFVTDAIALAATNSTRSARAITSAYYRSLNRDGFLDKHRPLKILEQHEEIMLLDYLIAMSALDCGRSTPDIIAVVEEWFGKTVNKMWVSRFLKSHSKLLSFEKGVYLGKVRAADEEIVQSCVLHLQAMKRFHERFHFSAKNTINYDETRCTIASDGKVGLRRVELKEKKKKHRRGGVGTIHSFTLVPFIAADGKLISVHLVFKNGAKVFLPQNRVYRSRGSTFEVYLYTTETGYVDSDSMKLIMEDFRRAWNMHHKGLHCMVIGDNLGARRRGDCQIRNDRRVLSLFFPSGHFPVVPTT